MTDADSYATDLPGVSGELIDAVSAALLADAGDDHEASSHADGSNLAGLDALLGSTSDVDTGRDLDTLLADLDRLWRHAA